MADGADEIIQDLMETGVRTRPADEETSFTAFLDSADIEHVRATVERVLGEKDAEIERLEERIAEIERDADESLRRFRHAALMEKEQR